MPHPLLARPWLRGGMNREDWETLPGRTKFNSPLTNEVGKFLPFRSPLLPSADRSVAKQLRLRGGTPIAEVFSTVKSLPKPAVFLLTSTMFLGLSISLPTKSSRATSFWLCSISACSWSFVSKNGRFCLIARLFTETENYLLN